MRRRRRVDGVSVPASDGARTRDGLPQPAQPLAAPRPLPRRSGSNNLCVPIQRCDRQLPACWAATRGTGRARFAARAFGQCWRWTQPRTILKPRPESSTDRCRPARTASGRARERSVLCSAGGSQLGQPGAALPRFTCYTRLGVHPSFLTQLLNANDELLRSCASALQACVATPALWSSHSGRKCGATRRRRPT